MQDGKSLSEKLKEKLDNNFTFIRGEKGYIGFTGSRGYKNALEESHSFTSILDDKYYEAETGQGFCSIGNLKLKSGKKFVTEVLKKNGFYRRRESANNIEKNLEKCKVYTMFPFSVKKIVVVKQIVSGVE